MPHAVDQSRVMPRGVHCDTARPGDDAAIRALLRGSAMGDAMAICMTREPDAFAADAIMGDCTHTTVLRSSENEVLGVGSRHVRECFVNGSIQRVGYLGMLRRDERVARQARLLPMCYQHLLRTHTTDEADFDLTSIVDDNTSARRLLERGLPGMPRYTRLAPWLTLLIPTMRRGPACDFATTSDMSLIATLLQSAYQQHQLAPVWREQHLPPSPLASGLAPGDFLVVRDGSHITGCAAVWDQRRLRQLIVSRYGARIHRWRRLINAGASLSGQPGLPAPGSELRMGYLSHWAVPSSHSGMLCDLVRACRTYARQKGLDWLAMGMSPDGPHVNAVCHATRPRLFRSTLYLVHHPDNSPARDLDARVPHVEVATL